MTYWMHVRQSHQLSSASHTFVFVFVFFFQFKLSASWLCACLPLEGRTLHCGRVCTDKQAPAGLAPSGADVFSVQLPNVPSPPPTPPQNPDQAQIELKEKNK